jgi:hypothetical protein
MEDHDAMPAKLTFDGNTQSLFLKLRCAFGIS